MADALTLFAGVVLLALIAVMAVTGWALSADQVRDLTGGARIDSRPDEVTPQTTSGPVVAGKPSGPFVSTPRRPS